MHTYYQSLSEAIAVINGGTAETVAAESAKAAIITSSGELTKVKLLADVTESATITVNADIDLVLNGYTLSFTEVGAYLSFGAGTNSLIHGAGGSIIKDLETTASADAKLVSAEGSSLRIKGGTYKVDGSISGIVLPLRATGVCDLLELEDCTVEAKNTSATAIGIQTQAQNTFMRNTKSTADAHSFAYGIMTAGNVTITNTTATASSAVSDSNALRVMSGTVSAKDCSFSAVADDYIASAIYIVDGAVTIDGSNIRSDAYNYWAQGIDLKLGSLELLHSSVTATAHKGQSADGTGITSASGTILSVKESIIVADSTPNCNHPGNNTVGIYSSGIAYLENARVNANHSAVTNGANAKLYVKGGSYTGFCHGGFYFAHGSGGEAFVNDATLRGGHYEGIFDYSEVSNDIKYATMYIGGGEDENNSSVTAYLDGCFFDASDCHRAIVLRGSHNEENNTLNVSNCHVTNGTLDNGTIRIDNDTLKLNVGRGCNVTSDMFKNYFLELAENGSIPQTPADYIEEGVVEYTGALYRKFPV